MVTSVRTTSRNRLKQPWMFSTMFFPPILSMSLSMTMLRLTRSVPRAPRLLVKCQKNTPPVGKNWLVGVTLRDTAGKPIHKPDGTFEKTKIRMHDATFNDRPQPLYFPPGHPRAGVFKGMVKILEERGFEDIAKKRYECQGFKCPAPALDCCVRRTLFNQPDFTDVKSILKTACEARGVQVIFLPKFHCELNPIEQCWGYAKRLYRLNPESSCEDALEKNALAALEAIPLHCM